MTQYIHEQTQTKTCTKCGVEKPLGEYHRNRRKPDGLQSQCKACVAEYYREWRAANLERKAETDCAWREANRERKAETDRAWKEANRERVAETEARRRAKYPERIAARNVVNNAVRRGDFPPPSALVCDYCQEAQAEHWHHHLGYSPEHWLDVIPVCIPCHVESDKE